MNEAADLASSLPAIILMSVWWAFLSTLEVLLTPQPPFEAEPPPAGSARDDAAAGIADGRFTALRERHPDFDPAAFIGKAQGVYATVLEAYAQGDLKTLQPLLSDEVLRVFADACAARAARGETLELTFIGIESAEIVHVETMPDATEIGILFRSQIVRAERSGDGTVTGGDPAAVVAATDLWTFARPAPQADAGWTIVSTDEA